MGNKQTILQVIGKAKSAIPHEILPDLPDSELTGRPEMHPFEYEIWGFGEKIRLLLIKEPKLKSDTEIQKGILEICLNEKAKRGRESFVMLMGSVKFAKHAPEIASLINDPYVSGHAIDALLKMKQRGFDKDIAPFMDSKITWVRKAAKKYCEKYSGL